VHFTQNEIKRVDRLFRLNLVNSLTGIKPANLIGTCSADGLENLAIISSVVHIGSDPALIGFFVRPHEEVKRHSYLNIRETGHYTINHLPSRLTEQGHWTSAKFEREESEFEHCRFTPEYLGGFDAPYVAESPIRIGMEFRQAIPVELNGTTLVIGEVIHALVDDALIDEQGYINLETAGSSGISGLNSYYEFRKIGEYPYARRHQLPDFD
jgi:flavin reductase (DIM6/NTAB) family NADH-FMN oxidoreductase RutF